MIPVGLFPGEEEATFLTSELLVVPPGLLSHLQPQQADLDVVRGVAVLLVAVPRDPLLAVLLLSDSKQSNNVDQMKFINIPFLPDTMSPRTCIYPSLLFPSC